MEESLFQLDDLKKAGVESNLEKSINDFTIDIIAQGHYSSTGQVTLRLADGAASTIFFKKGSPTVDRGDSYGKEEYLKIRHLQEGMYLNIIYRQINPSLVPRLLGRLIKEDNTWLFMKLLEGASAQQDYAQLMAKSQNALPEEKMKMFTEVLQQKLDFLRRDLRQIAKFNGECHIHRARFPRPIRSFLQKAHQNRRENHSKRLEYYLKRSVHYWHFGGNEMEQFSPDEVYQRIKQEKGVDLGVELSRIETFREKIKLTFKLQHGDCRVQHNFGGAFCDLEDFGYYPVQHDIVTYMSNDAAAPPVSQLPSLLAYYFLFEKAYSSKSSTLTIEELEKGVDPRNPGELNRLIKKKIRRKNPFPDFVVGHFAQMLEEDIVIDGVNKKYTSDNIQNILKAYPGLTPDSFQRSKMEHVRNLYRFMTSVEAGDLFGKCTNRKEVMAYFYHVGKLLTNLGLVNIDGLGYLEKLSKGSQYSLFFGDQHVKRSA